jgi:hypothetical protein
VGGEAVIGTPLLNRLNDAVCRAFADIGYDDPLTGFVNVRYVVWMNEDDARDLHAEMATRHPTWYTFEEFVDGKSAIRVDVTLPRGRIEVEFP